MSKKQQKVLWSGVEKGKLYYDEIVLTIEYKYE